MTSAMASIIPIARGIECFLQNNMPYSFSLVQDSSEPRRLPVSSTLASVCTSLKCLGCITTYSFDSPTESSLDAIDAKGVLLLLLTLLLTSHPFLG
jgi:hypothetical protein